jgi:hypothetical protein
VTMPGRGIPKFCHQLTRHQSHGDQDSYGDDDQSNHSEKIQARGSLAPQENVASELP